MLDAKQEALMSVNDLADDLEAIALSAAFTAGAVEACRFHPEVTIYNGDPDADKHAYALSMIAWKKGGRIFEASEVTDAVQDVFAMAAEDGCPQCAYLGAND